MNAEIITDLSHSFVYLMPELVLIAGSLIALIAGVWCKDEQKSFSLAVSMVLIALLIAGYWSGFAYPMADSSKFLLEAMLKLNGFTQLMKFLVIIAAFISLYLAYGYCKISKIMTKPEFPALVGFSVAGMCLMVSSHDLLSFYMGLELQSLILYVLAAMHRDNSKSAESGMKYFILGALSSALILYGSSFIYGVAGGTNFQDIKASLASLETVPVMFIIGLVLVLAGLCFKISAVPFHMWTPDVYHGAPTPVVAFFSAAPKIAMFGFIVQFMFQTLSEALFEWQQILIFVSAASMIIGSVAALTQTNIKRLMAYSSIGHMGYALIAVASNHHDGIYGLIIYLSIYLTMSLGLFAAIMTMRTKIAGQSDEFTEKIQDLSGLAKYHPLRAAMISILLLSMAGIPPLAGFWGKLFVFKAALSSGLYILAVIGILSSVIACYYYIRIIKVMYFDDVNIKLLARTSKEISFTLALAALFNLLFFVYPVPLVKKAEMTSFELVNVAKIVDEEKQEAYQIGTSHGGQL